MLGVDEPIALGPFRVNLATTRLLRDGAELELRPASFSGVQGADRKSGPACGLQADDPRGVGRRAGLAPHRCSYHRRDQACFGRVRFLD